MSVKKHLPVSSALKTLPTSTLINQLLQTNHYDELNELLYRIEQSLPSIKENQSLKDILLAARQICLACSICENDAEWHQWAAHEAIQQEHELKHLLHSLTDVIQRGVTERNQASETDEVSHLAAISLDTFELTKSNGKNHGFWQRVQHLFSRDTPSNGYNGRAPSLSYTPSPRRSEADQTSANDEFEQHADPAACAFAVHGLGTFRVYQHDQPLENWLNRKSKLIFKYLLLHRKQPVPKEILMDCFWRDADLEAARNNLNVTIYNLRQILRQHDETVSHIVFLDDCYLLNPDLNLWIDFEAFQTHFENARRLEHRGDLSQTVQEYSAAELLYQGQLFDEDRYEEWLIPPRRQLQDAYLHTLDYLSRHHLNQRNYGACVMLCNKMLNVDSCREDAHRQLMNCYSQQGQYYLALRQYHLCVEAYDKELNTRPSAETTALYERIRDHHTLTGHT